MNTTGLAGSQRGYLFAHITMSSKPLINDFYFVHAALRRTANVSGIFTAWRSGIMIIFSEVSYTEPSLAAFATKRVDHALLHMIPLLLCASHIAKLLFYFLFSKSKRAEGSQIYLRGCPDCGFYRRSLFCRTSFDDDQTRGRLEDPRTVGLCGGDGLGRGS